MSMSIVRLLQKLYLVHCLIPEARTNVTHWDAIIAIAPGKRTEAAEELRAYELMLTDLEISHENV